MLLIWRSFDPRANGQLEQRSEVGLVQELRLVQVWGVDRLRAGLVVAEGAVLYSTEATPTKRQTHTYSTVQHMGQVSKLVALLSHLQ